MILIPFRELDEWEQCEQWDRETEQKEDDEAKREGIYVTRIPESLRNKLKERLENGSAELFNL